MHHRSGVVHLFELEPGDGTCYRVLFGRLPSSAPDGELEMAIRAITAQPSTCLFGFAEWGDPIPTLVISADSVTRRQFDAQWSTVAQPQALGDADYLAAAAWAVWCALVGAQAAPPDETADWRANWREQVPTAALG